MRLSVFRFVMWSLVGVVTIVLLVTATRMVDPSIGAKNSAAAVPIGGEFDLIDEDGAKRSWASFRGKPVAVFFGFTNCPDICPTTLTELTALLQKMGAKGDDLAVLLVTADPKRDTPELLKTYLSFFDPRITALTGAEAEIEQAFSAFKAYRKIVPLDGEDYTVDHSAGVYLYDRQGAFAGTLDMHESQDVRISKLERLVSR